MTEMYPAIKRVVWMTPDQRKMLWTQLTAEVGKMEAGTEKTCYLNVISELETVKKRERISGRLVESHVSGLKLPHDALPVKITDDEAWLLLELDIEDKTLCRLLQPGPLKPGRR